MKVSLSLKLREAWRSKFEERPRAPKTAVEPPHNGEVKEVDVYSEESTLGDDNPFKNLKPSVKPAPAASTSLSFNPTLGYRDECITVDARMNRKGDYVLVKGSEAFDPKQEPKKATRKPNALLDPYCLVVTRRFNLLGVLECTILDIQSPQLVMAMRDVVDYYPDTTFRIGDTIKCEDPPKLVFHHRHELAEYKARQSTDDKTKAQVGYLLNFLQAHLGEQIALYEAFLATGMVTFKHLWMMFKPGCLVYEEETQQLYYLEKGDYAETICGTAYVLECYYVNYTGEKIGKVKKTLAINAFENPRKLSALQVIPLTLCDKPEDIRDKLLQRAKRFLELRGIHALQHSSKGRVMVDAKTFLLRVVPDDEDKPESLKKGIAIFEESNCQCGVCRGDVEESPDDYDHKVREICEDEMLLCSSYVLGFTLTSHKWTRMKIDDLSEVEWNADAIDRLVLDAKQKRVLSSLISSPVFTEGVKGDVIGWKGKGLVMLLHGAPGTGKTLTAESVCESLKRPLYIISGGELGTRPEEVETSLKEILELSKWWKAVILIDEADVFLEARSSHDIVRNNFVSVFLRRLEYFEGILMLTTNRVEQFDEAFVSRIHLSLCYPGLEPWMRKEIWANALKRFPADEVDIKDGSELEKISKAPLNGRVISYAVRTAKAIADEDKSKLKISHLWDVVSVQQKFSEHLRLDSKRGVPDLYA